MDYFLRKFPQVPFTVIMVIYCGAWAFLCAIFAYFLILSQADFEATGTREIFIFTFLFYLFIAEIGTLVQHGILRSVGIKEWARKFRVLNENIKGGHLSPDISTKALKEVFYSLSRRPIDGAVIGSANSGMVILASIITEYFASGGMVTNLFTIFISGVIVILMLVVFIIFFIQYFISFSLKECRLLLMQRGIKIKEPQFRFNKLGTKLDLSLTIPIFTVLIICLVFQLDFNIVIFVFISLIMATSISRMLSSSIYQSFSEIKNFVNELPKGKKIHFFTGSLSPEVIRVAVRLNRAAEEVYNSKIKVEQSKQELENRVVELEKWYRSTVDRELEMVKLKKEIEGLKKKI
ncbi:MAG: hypothetical protein ABH919_03065 [bacterium]